MLVKMPFTSVVKMSSTRLASGAKSLSKVNHAKDFTFPLYPPVVSGQARGLPQSRPIAPDLA